ncbi:phenylalanyl-tRNA synthetase beta subunit [Limimonas halophila]|uniref:Phenylalanine--tRNA ligase beta subunit n=1 Tax=Limimonas halophila TaxID=1082479 RepID=A0A1G7L4D4_9PROT|nr:phenylalanine--tRNA ligase subunit beta [Limimonas halophila]SDF44216.1 phenylalanyl-tRNA synthetase beta subunit [Limimonas halophila]
MKFTLSWLRDHLATEASLERLTDALTMLGHEVEEVDDPAARLAPFRTAYVRACEQHPNADKLSVCTVVTPEGGEAQVVCGAPNARAGMIGVFAGPGTHIPGSGITLKKGKIRGVESQGMLVSEYELGLSEDHEGIIEMPAGTPQGAPFAEQAGLDDPVIEVALTPNRADCFGVRGLARDLAAAGLGELRPLERAAPTPGGHASPIAWHRKFSADHAGACPYVAGRHFGGVRNGHSPAWMRRRLEAVGLRPISALVDITNYVTVDLGRPLHVFDADKLDGDLAMRFAEDGETIAALDEQTYTLDSEMVVIADRRQAHGIGGVIGGAASGVSEATTNVFLEVALFDPVRIATTGRKLGIVSDARQRFERGVDPESADWGVHVATRLIQEICGGEASEVVAAGQVPRHERTITLRPERVGALTGVEVPEATSADILDRLGFEPERADGRIATTVPSWRFDMDGEADLVEEVMRVHGYDAIPEQPLPRDSAVPAPAVSFAQRRAELARTRLAWRGLEETVGFSFVSSRSAELFGGAGDEVRLANPISSALDVMRPSVLASLADSAQRNSDRGFPDVALFEVGPAYRDATPDGQATVAAGLRAGRAHARHWASGERPADVFDAKADALAALDAAGAPTDKLTVTTEVPGHYHPGRSGALVMGKVVVAYFGELHPTVVAAHDLREPVAAFEVFLDALPKPKKKGTARPALARSAFQPVVKDFAFVVDADVPADNVLRAVRAAGKDLVSDATVFDVYTGEKIGAGKKSLALAVTLQPRERTLTDEDLSDVAARIVDKVRQDTGGELRG